MLDRRKARVLLPDWPAIRHDSVRCREAPLIDRKPIGSEATVQTLGQTKTVSSICVVAEIDADVDAIHNLIVVPNRNPGSEGSPRRNREFGAGSLEIRIQMPSSEEALSLFT